VHHFCEVIQVVEQAAKNGNTVLSEAARKGLGPIADYFIRALTFDSVYGDEHRYRAVTISLRLCGALDLWRLYTWERVEYPTWAWVAVFVFALLGIFRPFERLATIGFAFAYWAGLMGSFPMTWNHTWLAVYMFTWLSLVSPKTVDGRKLAMAGIRTITVYSLIGAGIQKALHTTYFRGEFITGRAWQFATGPMGSFLFTEQDIERFSNVDRVWEGIRLVPESFMVKLAANVVWIGEIIAGILLLIPRTFLWGLALVAAIMVPIQLSTLEFGFLGVLLAALVTYVPAKPARWAPVVLGLYAVAVQLFWWGDPFANG
jgi:hypothetical protein